MKLNPDKVKKLHLEKKFSLLEMANAAGWSSARRFAQIMEGRSTNVNPRIGEAIARKFKVKVSEITGE